MCANVGNVIFIPVVVIEGERVKDCNVAEATTHMGASDQCVEVVTVDASGGWARDMGDVEMGEGIDRQDRCRDRAW